MRKKLLIEVLGEPARLIRKLILLRLYYIVLLVRAGLLSPWSGGLGRGDLIVVTWCVMTWW